MSTFKNKDSLITIEAQIVQKLKNNEARPKFTGSYKQKKRVNPTIAHILFSRQCQTQQLNGWNLVVHMKVYVVLFLVSFHRTGRLSFRTYKRNHSYYNTWDNLTFARLHVAWS